MSIDCLSIFGSAAPAYGSATAGSFAAPYRKNLPFNEKKTACTIGCGSLSLHIFRPSRTDTVRYFFFLRPAIRRITTTARAATATPT